MPLVLFFTLWFSAADPPTHVQHGLRLPVGFEVVEYAGSDLANDIYCLTTDSKGRVVVAGRGYIRILVDDNQDGRADRAIDFADNPKDGAMGLLWEGDTLFVTGDGGLRRFRDANGDDRADGASELIRAMKTGGEHDSHALRRGPDGWLYVLCGDHAGIDKNFATLPTSPVAEPIGGCVLRFSPDLKGSEIVAHGFRNAYDMDFSPEGELFTFDSDNERCVSLPWYEPTRFYHVISGGHYGWLAPQRAQFWRPPPYFPDVIPAVATLGRGSPTACVCYRHAQFPRPYRGGFFLCDWTFGRVYHLTPAQTGRGYSGMGSVFLQSVGDNGFAPTSAVVHPQTGDLYISTGGRGTRGAVYRIRHAEGLPGLDPRAVARLQPPRRTLDWSPDLKADLIRRASGADQLARLRAVLEIHRHRAQFTRSELLELLEFHLDQYEPPLVRWAVARLIATLPEADVATLRFKGRLLSGPLLVASAIESTHQREVLELACEVLQRKEQWLPWRPEAVRVLQRAMGDISQPSSQGTIWEGYSAKTKLPDDIMEKVRCVFPTGNRDLDRELSRLFAMQGQDDAVARQKVVAVIRGTTDPIEAVHYLAVYARLKPRASSADAQIILRSLLALDQWLAERKLPHERNWPLRVGEIFRQLNEDDHQWQELLVQHSDFGRAEHVLFCSHFLGRRPAQCERRAAEVFVTRASDDPGFAWTPEHVRLIAKLETEAAYALVRNQWPNGALRDAIVLALPPRSEDRDKFLAGLESTSVEVIRRCLERLSALPKMEPPNDLLRLLRAYQRCEPAKNADAKSLRERFVQELQRATGQTQIADDPVAWAVWFRQSHPDLAARLDGPDDVDLPAWRKRLERLDWTHGNATAGLKVYQRLGCASCHSGANALGPDLNGVAQRFSRDDLFTALLQPSKDVSSRYQTITLGTADGKLYHGTVIYEAVDGVILQTGPTATVRIPGDAITQRQPSPRSLMPAGLLDPCSDGEIVDLYAYLRNLGAKKPRRRKPSTRGAG